MLSGVILSIWFAALLVHVLMGNKNKWLTNITVQMILSNLGGAVLGNSAVQMYCFYTITQPIILAGAIANAF
jgi:hypothetical protein